METTATPRVIAHNKYQTSRRCLLLMAGFTLINIILYLINSTDKLLFSARLPYFFALGGFSLCMESSIAMISLGIVTLFLTAVGLLLYFLCWLLSKKHYGWMICALVLYIIDTVTMVHDMQFGFSQIIMDVLMHIWVLYYLIIGVKYGAQLKKLPPDPVDIPAELPEEPAEEIPAEE